MSSALNLVELRQLLAERFPQARFGLPAPVVSRAPVATGVPALDTMLGGGLPRGELTELVGSAWGSGSGLVLHALLRQAARGGLFTALVDGADSFEPAAADGDVLARLLWVRCARADEALKAADLLLRDPNLPLVVIDLKMNPVRQLRQISSSVWHRLARLLEPHETTVLVITPRPLVTGATCRVQCDHRSGIEDLARAPADLWPALRFSMLRPPAVAGAQPAVQAG